MLQQPSVLFFLESGKTGGMQAFEVAREPSEFPACNRRARPRRPANGSVIRPATAPNLRPLESYVR